MELFLNCNLREMAWGPWYGGLQGPVLVPLDSGTVECEKQGKVRY